MDRTFERDRALLDHQYESVCYDPETGLSREELRAEADTLEKRLSGEAPLCVKAALFKLTLEKARIHVDAFDWIADHIDFGDALSALRSRQWTDSGLKTIGAPVDPLAESGLLTAGLDTSHTSPDWERLLTLGLCGLQSAAETRKEQLAAENALTTRRRDFLDGVITVYGAMRTLCRRLSAQAEKERARHPEDEARLKAVSAALAHIADHPPRTLHEAVQLAYIYHECQEFEGEPVRSMGGFDRLYGRFYENDLAVGRLTRDQAKELIKYFFNKFYARTQDKANGKNFYFGGELPDGESAVNDLSYLALEAYREMRTVNPKLSVRVSANTPQDFVALATDCIREGCSGIVFCNDRSIIETMMKFGKTREDARRYVPIGCYEPAAEGLEMNRSVSATVNLPKLVELALNDGFDPVYNRQSGPHTGLEFGGYAAFEEAVFRQADYILDLAMDTIRSAEACWPRFNPSPVLSGTMAPCLDAARDVSRGGAKYNNAGIVCGSLGTAVDALVAVKRLVFEEKRLTLAELRDVLRSDWENDPRLRLIALKKLPKWGNGDPEADEIARRLNARLAACVNGQPNTLGGVFQLAQFSIDFTVRFGKSCGATPDGRRRGEMTSKNLAAVTAMDRRGVTAMIESAGRLDQTQFPDGAVLDCILHPSAVRGAEGLKAFVQLIDTYFSLGGLCIQFNVFDAATLRAAQENPEKYASLQVRVCGWNVFFNHLSRAEQDEFIRQAEHEEGIR